jgi:hypothetical protein
MSDINIDVVSIATSAGQSVPAGTWDDPLVVGNQFIYDHPDLGGGHTVMLKFDTAPTGPTAIDAKNQADGYIVASEAVSADVPD